MYCFLRSVRCAGLLDLICVTAPDTTVDVVIVNNHLIFQMSSNIPHYKIVQTEKNGKLELVAVPCAWEKHGKLKWPTKNSTVLHLLKDPCSVPGEKGWKQMDCVVKRTHVLTFEEAEVEIDAMMSKSDTSGSECDTNKMPPPTIVPKRVTVHVSKNADSDRNNFNTVVSIFFLHPNLLLHFSIVLSYLIFQAASLANRGSSISASAIVPQKSFIHPQPPQQHQQFIQQPSQQHQQYTQHIETVNMNSAPSTSSVFYHQAQNTMLPHQPRQQPQLHPRQQQQILYLPNATENNAFGAPAQENNSVYSVLAGDQWASQSIVSPMTYVEQSPTDDHNAIDLYALLKTLTDDLSSLNKKVDHLVSLVEGKQNNLVKTAVDATPVVLSSLEAIFDPIDTPEELEAFNDKLRSENSYAAELVSIINMKLSYRI